MWIWGLIPQPNDRCLQPVRLSRAEIFWPGEQRNQKREMTLSSGFGDHHRPRGNQRVFDQWFFISRTEFLGVPSNLPATPPVIGRP